MQQIQCPQCFGEKRTRTARNACSKCQGMGYVDAPPAEPAAPVQPHDAHADDRALVRELCDVDDGLTEWECDFADDLGNREKQYGPNWRGLTEKQRNKAQQILGALEERRRRGKDRR